CKWTPWIWANVKAGSEMLMMKVFSTEWLFSGSRPVRRSTTPATRQTNSVSKLAMSHITARSSRAAVVALPGAALPDEVTYVEREKGRHSGSTTGPRRNCSIKTTTLARGTKRPKDRSQDHRWLYPSLVTSYPRYRECKAANCAHSSLHSRQRLGDTPGRSQARRFSIVRCRSLSPPFLARMCEPVHTCLFFAGISVEAGYGR